jgi:hypothetical protein
MSENITRRHANAKEYKLKAYLLKESKLSLVNEMNKCSTTSRIVYRE